MIEYMWEGDDCTLTFKKADADTWYTVTQNDNGNGTGTLTIKPEIYTATDVDRSGTVTVSVMKNGNPAITHTITVTQLKKGEAVKNEYTETFKNFTTANSGYTNTGNYISTEVTIDGVALQWAYTSCALNQGGAKFVLGKNSDKATLTSGTISDGISEIRIGWKAPFSSDKLQMTVYVNNVSVGTLNITAASGDSGTETISGLNIAGNAVIKITGAGKVGSKDNRPGINSISWSSN